MGERSVKKLFILPPSNLLEDNGVVFEKFTINNLQFEAYTFYL